MSETDSFRVGLVGLPSRVRYARTRIGLPMHVLAARAGLSNAYVSLLESGRYPNPRIDSVAKLATALSATLDWLVFGKGEPPAVAGPSARGESPGVYFIQQSDGAIKIGFSVRPELRVRQLQTAASSRLALLAVLPGTVVTEREIQARFAAHRLHGEWFSPAPELLAFIREACAGRAA